MFLTSCSPKNMIQKLQTCLRKSELNLVEICYRFGIFRMFDAEDEGLSRHLQRGDRIHCGLIEKTINGQPKIEETTSFSSWSVLNTWMELLHSSTIRPNEDEKSFRTPSRSVTRRSPHRIRWSHGYTKVA